ncbi:MAG TPA: selenide, water dikinase SelD [Actinomycetota bacterium]
MRAERRLTSFSHGAGCGCKLGADALASVLADVPLPARDGDLLVAAETGDDAAVYAMPGGGALVATVDVFTPIVDDPYDWGRIAAANALSDVYAMGGSPKFALNVAAWPVDDLPIGLLGEVLRGGRDVAASAGAAVAGGHTITSTEPIYGMVAIGFVDPDRMLRNDAARPGMTLFLTKPIGTGMIATAIKRGDATAAQADAAVATMTALNADAASAAVDAGVRATTDVTGFGLLGHLRRMLEVSGCAGELDAAAVPLLPGVLDLARRDVVAGGTKRNLAWVAPLVDWGELTTPERQVLADAQTSGGLLLATDRPGVLRANLRGAGVAFAEIGAVVDGEAGRIAVRGRVAPD